MSSTAGSQNRKRSRHSLPIIGRSQNNADAPTTPKQPASVPSKQKATRLTQSLEGPSRGQREQGRRASSQAVSPTASNLRIRLAKFDDQFYIDRIRNHIAGHATHDQEGMPRFTEDEEDVDEISLLGLAAIESSSSPQSTRRRDNQSPTTFVDDMSIKVESPANISIGKFFEDDNDDRPSKKEQDVDDEIGAASTEKIPMESVEELQIADILPDRVDETLHSQDIVITSEPAADEQAVNDSTSDAVNDTLPNLDAEVASSVAPEEPALEQTISKETIEDMPMPEKPTAEVPNAGETPDPATLASQSVRENGSFSPVTLQATLATALQDNDLEQAAKVPGGADMDESSSVMQDHPVSGVPTLETISMQGEAEAIAETQVSERYPLTPEDDSSLHDDIPDDAFEVEMEEYIIVDVPSQDNEMPNHSPDKRSTEANSSVVADEETIEVVVTPSRSAQDNMVSGIDVPDENMSDVVEEPSSRETPVVDCIVSIVSDDVSHLSDAMQDALNDDAIVATAEDLQNAANTHSGNGNAEYEGSHDADIVDPSEAIASQEIKEDLAEPRPQAEVTVDSPESDFNANNIADRIEDTNSHKDDIDAVLNNVIPVPTEGISNLPVEHLSRSSIADVLEESPAQRSTSEGQSHQNTPSKGLASLPFAGEEFINTPARPVEDFKLMQYVEQRTPTKSSLLQKVQRTPPVKEDAFLDNYNSPHSRDLVAVNLEPFLADSFVTTAADEDSIHELDCIEQDDEVEAEVPEKLTQQVFATPQPTNTLQRFQKNQSPVNGVLGSAIRLVSREASPDLSMTDREDDDIVSLKDTLMRDDAKQAKRKEFTSMSMSEPRKLATRPTTPPPKKRYSMDIPLSKYNRSIEIWETHEDSFPSPPAKSTIRLPAPPENLRTPSPKIRLSMDVPLPREQSPIEVWPAENGARARRTLLSPQHTKRLSLSSQLIVDESPQANIARTPRFPERPLVSLPKLDFGIAIEHSHTLSDSEDVPRQLLSPAQLDDQEVEDVDADANADMILLASPESLRDQFEIEDLYPDRRRSVSKHFTPRSTKLRMLAHHLSETRHSEDLPSDDEDDILGNVEDRAERNSEALTPRTAMRKQLSDDIDLDFAPETSTPLLPTQKAVIRSSGKSAQSQQKSLRIATPVFKNKRKRPSSPFVSPILAAAPSTESQPEDELIVSKTQSKTTVRQSRQQIVLSPRKSIIKRQRLATFGIDPEILPRTRRERKKPTEFWKVSDTAAKEEAEGEEEEGERIPSEPAHSQTHAATQRKPRAQARSHQESQVKASRKRVRSPAAPPQRHSEPAASKRKKKQEQVSLAPTAEVQKAATSKRKKRPSDFGGPLSAHRKIKASTSARPSPAPTAPVPAPRKIRSYNFEEDGDDTLA